MQTKHKIAAQREQITKRTSSTHNKLCLMVALALPLLSIFAMRAHAEDYGVTADPQSFLEPVGKIITSHLSANVPATTDGLKEGENVSTRTVTWDASSADAICWIEPAENTNLLKVDLRAVCDWPCVSLIIPCCTVVWEGDQGSVITTPYTTSVTLTAWEVSITDIDYLKLGTTTTLAAYVLPEELGYGIRWTCDAQRSIFVQDNQPYATLDGTTVTIQGIGVSTNFGDAYSVAQAISSGQPVANMSATTTYTVYNLDLDWEGMTDEAGELREDSPGAFIAVGQSLHLYPIYGGLQNSGVTVTLETPSGGDKIAVLDGATTLALPKTWNLGSEALPGSLTVKGLASSGNVGDIALTWSCNLNNEFQDYDSVTLTVCDFSITNIDWIAVGSTQTLAAIVQPNDLPCTVTWTHGSSTAPADKVKFVVEGTTATVDTTSGMTAMIIGLAPSQSLDDAYVNAAFDAAFLTANCRTDFTVVQVDLDIDSNNNGTINDIVNNAYEDDIEEQFPGKLIYLNWDDDNLNGIPDRDEVTTEAGVADENELQPLSLSYAPRISTGVLTLEGVNGNIRLWRSANKTSGTQQTLFSWNLATEASSVPATLYIEGIVPGDFDLQLKWSVGGIIAKDRVVGGVVSTDFSRCAATEFGYDEVFPVVTPADRYPTLTAQLMGAQLFDYVDVNCRAGYTTSTHVTLTVNPAKYAPYVFFDPAVGAGYTCIPDRASASPQDIEIIGRIPGESRMSCRLGSKQGAEAASLGTAVYNMGTRDIRYYSLSDNRISTSVVAPGPFPSAACVTGSNAYLGKGVARVNIIGDSSIANPIDLNGNGYIDFNYSGVPTDEFTSATSGVVFSLAVTTLIHTPYLLLSETSDTCDAVYFSDQNCIFLADSPTADIATRLVGHELGHTFGLADAGPPDRNTSNLMYFQTSVPSLREWLLYYPIQAVQTGRGNLIGLPAQPQWNTIVHP
ncbi:MAG: hypothetical protein NTX50_29240 [Candidatus Sumerlaeota bacterium]|nr:hypothetical protein [Candidatus Sumerlaeota bacterium]